MSAYEKKPYVFPLNPDEDGIMTLPEQPKLRSFQMEMKQQDLKLAEVLPSRAEGELIMVRSNDFDIIAEEQLLAVEATYTFN